MCKKSTLIVVAAIAALGLSSQAFAQSLSASNGTGQKLPSGYRSNGARHAGNGTGHDALATVSVTTGLVQAVSCSDQIADLRKAARLSHQPIPETVWQAQTYAELMFSADLALAEAQYALGRNDECLLSARHAKEELQGQPVYTAREN
jgi:hypothetical protein